MAVLMAPDFIDFAGSDEPKTLAMLISDLMPQTADPIVTRPLIMFPDLSQLASLGAGYVI